VTVGRDVTPPKIGRFGEKNAVGNEDFVAIEERDGKRSSYTHVLIGSVEEPFHAPNDKHGAQVR
jgi:hypothetical protein